MIFEIFICFARSKHGVHQNENYGEFFKRSKNYFMPSLKLHKQIIRSKIVQFVICKSILLNYRDDAQ